MRGRPFKKGESKGRPKGAKNRKTIILERVYQRCCARGFHPADLLIEVALDYKYPIRLRLECCKDLQTFMEGRQPEGKPLSPATPGDSVGAVQRMMQEAAARAKPIEPAPPANP
jgi:hypothetical protein